MLGASFAIRAAGDIGDGTLSWFSPMGWAQKARPYAGERWWPLLLCLAARGGAHLAGHHPRRAPGLRRGHGGPAPGAGVGRTLAREPARAGHPTPPGGDPLVGRLCARAGPRVRLAGRQHRRVRRGQPGPRGHPRRRRPSEPDGLVPRDVPADHGPRRGRARPPDRAAAPHRGDGATDRSGAGDPDVAMGVGEQPPRRRPRRERAHARRRRARAGTRVRARRRRLGSGPATARRRPRLRPGRVAPHRAGAGPLRAGPALDGRARGWR